MGSLYSHRLGNKFVCNNLKSTNSQKSLWIKQSVKWLNVNGNFNTSEDRIYSLHYLSSANQLKVKWLLLSQQQPMAYQAALASYFSLPSCPFLLNILDMLKKNIHKQVDSPWNIWSHIPEKSANTEQLTGGQGTSYFSS